MKYVHWGTIAGWVCSATIIIGLALILNSCHIEEMQHRDYRYCVVAHPISECESLKP